ncbi:MAG: hypothetical protein FH753_06865 [Firmicutes bacterium]|nr:hypothetical protein [Bacillota bacterium]
MRNKIYFIILIFYIIMIFITIIKLRKIKKIKKESLIKGSLRLNNMSIVSMIIFFLMFLSYSYLLIDKIKSASFLFSEYNITFLKIFDIDFLEKIINNYIDNKKAVKATKVIYLKKSIIQNILFMSIFLGNMIVYLLDALPGDFLCNDYIYIAPYKIKKENIVDFKWGKEYKRKLINKNTKYQKLILTIKRGKLESRICNEKFKEYYMNIDVDKKKKARDILENLI